LRNIAEPPAAAGNAAVAGHGPRVWSFDAYVVGIAVSGDGKTFAVALGDGTVRLITEPHEPRTAEAHKGACLCIVTDIDGKGFLTGGDDGKLVRTDVSGETTVLAEHKGKWIEHIAANASSAYRAYAVGKDVLLIDRKGNADLRRFTHPSTVGGLAINDKGKRMVVTHYNGASLWWLGSQAERQALEWKGSNLEVAFSPDGDYIITAMQDSSLHGWRLSDKQMMNMSGYAAKVRSMSFNRKGTFLATGGADEVICWPFSGGGPMGKAPAVFGGGAAGAGRGSVVTTVACNPKHDLIAAGYGNGAVIMGQAGQQRSGVIMNASGSPISALCWDKAGEVLLMGDEAGHVALGDFRKSPE
jgi:WD40 repeat protein